MRTTSPLLALSLFFAAACSSSRGEPRDEDAREQAAADAGPGEVESQPPEAPPPKPVSAAAEAIDGLLERGGRLLAERRFDLAVELFEGAMLDSRAAGYYAREANCALGLGEALANQGREAEARAVAAELRKRRPGGPPPVEALRLAALESALTLALGRPLDAAPLARETLDETDRHHPGDADLRGLLVWSLADALVATEGFAEAARLIDDHLSRPGTKSHLAAETRAGWLDRVGRLHGAAGNFSLSVARLEESLAAWAEAGGDDPVPAAVTRVSLAASLFDAGYPAQARDEFLAARRVLSAALPPEHPERLRLAEVAARVGAGTDADAGARQDR